MRRIAPATLAVLTLTFGGGCRTVRTDALTGTGGSSGDYSYVGGRAAQTLASTPINVQPAVLSALDDLRFTSVRQINEAGAIVFEGTTPDNRRASVTLRPHPAGTTRLTARIGMFGDEPLSRALVDRVAIRMGTAAPQPIPDSAPSEPGSNPYFSKSAVSDADMLRDRADAPYRNSDAP